MDYVNYVEKKAEELNEIVKAGGGFAFASKRFDQYTGETKDPEIEAVSIENLNSRKALLQGEINAIDTIIADIDALNAEEEIAK